MAESTSAAPDLTALPLPIREMLEGALREREEAERKAAAEAESVARQRWEALMVLVIADLPADWLPFAKLPVPQPEDWTGEEQRYPVAIRIPGLAPIHAHYEAGVNDGIWVRVSGWFVAGQNPMTQPEALLIAYDAGDEEIPF